jgi:hypothetical protein
MDPQKVSKVLAKFLKKPVFCSKNALLGPAKGRVFLGSNRESAFEHSNVFVCTSYMTGLFAVYIILVGYGAMDTPVSRHFLNFHKMFFFAPQRVRRSWYNST